MAIITIHFEVSDNNIAAMLLGLPSKSAPKPAKKSVKKTEDAPYGFKKDGTPKKRPGRAPKDKQ